MWWNSESSALAQAVKPLIEQGGGAVGYGEVLPAPVKPEDNAAPIYDRASVIYSIAESSFLAWMRENSVEKGDAFPWMQDEDWTPRQKDLIEKFMALGDAGDVAELLKEAATKPESLFELEYAKGYELPMPHLARARNLTRFAAMKVRLASIAGKPDEAVSWVGVGMAISRSMEREPIVISCLVKMACEKIMHAEVQNLVLKQNLSAAQLKELEKALRPSGKTVSMADAMRLERAFAVEICVKLNGRRIPELLSMINGGDYPWYGAVGPVARPLLMRATANYIGDATRMVEVMALPDPDGLKASRALMNELNAKYQKDKAANFFGAAVMPALTKWREESMNARTRTETARIAAAMKAHKLEKGKLPAEQKTLVPDYLPALPMDPFTGKEYAVKHERGMLVVFSPNGGETRIKE